MEELEGNMREVKYSVLFKTKVTLDICDFLKQISTKEQHDDRYYRIKAIPTHDIKTEINHIKGGEEYMFHFSKTGFKNMIKFASYAKLGWTKEPKLRLTFWRVSKNNNNIVDIQVLK